MHAYARARARACVYLSPSPSLSLSCFARTNLWDQRVRDGRVHRRAVARVVE